MDHAEFNRRFGGSARTCNLKHRGVKIPQQSELPPDFIRLDPWEIEYLFGVAASCKVGILEIGRLMGGSTFVLAAAAPNIPIWSIDIKPQDDDELGDLFAETDTGENVELLIGDSKNRFPNLGAIDLLFIDGDHEYEGCHADLETWHGNLVPGGHIVMHDCCLKGVRKAALQFLEEHSDFAIKVSPVIIDSYWMFPTGSLGHLIKNG